MGRDLAPAACFHLLGAFPSPILAMFRAFAPTSVDAIKSKESSNQRHGHGFFPGDKNCVQTRTSESRDSTAPRSHFTNAKRPEPCSGNLSENRKRTAGLNTSGFLKRPEFMPPAGRCQRARESRRRGCFPSSIFFRIFRPIGSPEAKCPHSDCSERGRFRLATSPEITCLGRSHGKITACFLRSGY